MAQPLFFNKGIILKQAKSSVLWDIMLLSQLKVKCFGGTRCSGRCLHHTGFLFGLSFSPEDGADMYL
jgi:hypothetical protein